MTTPSIDPVDPGVIRPLPVTPPSLNDPANFDVRGDAVIGHLPVMIGDMNSVAAKTKQNADVAAASASAATNAAASVQNAAYMANMRGAWSDLSGALAVPATVYHRDAYWSLLRPVANVAASEPGVSADWALISSVTDEILAVMHAVSLAR